MSGAANKALATLIGARWRPRTGGRPRRPRPGRPGPGRRARGPPAGPAPTIRWRPRKQGYRSPRSGQGPALSRRSSCACHRPARPTSLWKGRRWRSRSPTPAGQETGVGQSKLVVDLVERIGVQHHARTALPLPGPAGGADELGSSPVAASTARGQLCSLHPLSLRWPCAPIPILAGPRPSRREHHGGPNRWLGRATCAPLCPNGSVNSKTQSSLRLGPPAPFSAASNVHSLHWQTRRR